MGERGRKPTPIAVRELTGNPQHRPMQAASESPFKPGIPDRPPMSGPAKKIWNDLVAEMAESGVLRRVDGGALAMLCEDVAMLATLRRGLAAQAREIAAKAKENGKKITGNPLTMLSRSVEARRTMTAIRELTAQIIIQRREFGLTPAAASRVTSTGEGAAFVDPLEKALCG